LAGINPNYGDTAKLSNIVASGVSDICAKYTGNNNGAEPPQVGSGADGKNCIYSASNISS
jgi:pectate lyase